MMKNGGALRRSARDHGGCPAPRCGAIARPILNSLDSVAVAGGFSFNPGPYRKKLCRDALTLRDRFANERPTSQSLGPEISQKACHRPAHLAAPYAVQEPG